MIKVVFFAQVRELVGVERIIVDESYATVDDLRQRLSQRGSKWQLALAPENLLMAVNYTLVNGHQPLQDGDEVAFFPPVTGG